MLHLENKELRLDILDPVADAARQGARYCWGGYVWQVHDRAAGPLLSGPEYPEPAPTPFNGQGLPESFRNRSRDDKPFTWRGGTGIAIGAGVITDAGKNKETLTTPCVWTISTQPNQLIFQTRQAAVGFSYELTRKLELTGRTIGSFTQLSNVGEQPLTLQWFAHPFFALKDGLTRAEFPVGSTLPENPGFAFNDHTLTSKRRFASKNDGQFVLLNAPKDRPFRVVLNHPVIDRVEFTASFAPNECPVWGNGNTFSAEPYLDLDLLPGQTRHWNVHYHFGTR